MTQTLDEKQIRRLERQNQALKHALVALAQIVWKTNPDDRKQVERIVSSLEYIQPSKEQGSSR